MRGAMRAAASGGPHPPRGYMWTSPGHVEDGLQQLPGALHPVLSKEQRVIALHRAEQQQLVRVDQR